MKLRAVPLFAVLLAAFGPLCGCARKSSPAPPEPLTQTHERGPYQLKLRAFPPELRVGDALTVELILTAPTGTVVAFPPADQLGPDWYVRDVDTGQPEPMADQSAATQRQTWTLVPLASGNQDLPALIVRYGRAAAADQDEPEYTHELATDPITIPVAGVLTTQESPNQPRDIFGVLLPPDTDRLTLAIVITAVTVAALAFALWGLLALRRRRTTIARPVPPGVWALQQLDRLDPATVTGQHAARTFYYELSDIVRQFIEQQFALAAPEMTTEEFLETLARRPHRLPSDAADLRPFLTACDLVKYAAAEATPTDAAEARDSARYFIERTAAATDPSTTAPAREATS